MNVTKFLPEPRPWAIHESGLMFPLENGFADVSVTACGTPLRLESCALRDYRSNAQSTTKWLEIQAKHLVNKLAATSPCAAILCTVRSRQRAYRKLGELGDTYLFCSGNGSATSGTSSTSSNSMLPVPATTMPLRTQPPT